MQNVGKQFENQLKQSIPNYAKLHRLPDPPQSFGGSSNLRFSSKNPFDFLLWDSLNRLLYTLEVKTVKGKSISFERNKDDKGTIHYHQIQGLNEWAKYNYIISGFLIGFRSITTTVFIDIYTFNTLTERINKKSFTLEDLKENNLPYFIIPQTLLRTKYIYDMDYFLKNYHKLEIYKYEEK